jgi:hypothetical protein
MWPQTRSGRSGGKKNLLPLLGIETIFIKLPTHNLVTMKITVLLLAQSFQSIQNVKIPNYLSAACLQ